MKKILKILAAFCSAIGLFFAILAAQIYFYDATPNDMTADAAVVLGAAVWGERLSPVFEERVKHAVNLYRGRRVRKIIFTGGQGNSDEETEASAARRFALTNGVAAEDILTEEKSTSTYENLLFTKPIAETNEIKTVLLVSDPLHMKRSVEIAEHFNFKVAPSPTPTTRYRGFSSQMKLLAHETYYYAGFLIRRALGTLPAAQ